MIIDCLIEQIRNHESTILNDSTITDPKINNSRQ